MSLPVFVPALIEEHCTDCGEFYVTEEGVPTSHECTTIVKRCGCSRAYTLRNWRKLRLGWREVIPADDDHPSTMFVEFRHCSCMSTISIDLLAVDHQAIYPEQGAL